VLTNINYYTFHYGIRNYLFSAHTVNMWNGLLSLLLLYCLLVHGSSKVDRARQLYKNISMLFLFPVTRDLLFTNI